MTYIARDTVISHIENKFEAVRVLALESRRLNDEMRAREASVDRKITTLAVENLFNDEIRYYDARERREQERSEAMLAAAEGILDAPVPEPVLGEEEGEAAEDSAPTEEAAEAPTEPEASAASDESPESTEAEPAEDSADETEKKTDEEE